MKKTTEDKKTYYSHVTKYLNETENAYFTFTISNDCHIESKAKVEEKKQQPHELCMQKVTKCMIIRWLDFWKQLIFYSYVSYSKKKKKYERTVWNFNSVYMHDDGINVIQWSQKQIVLEICYIEKKNTALK